MGFSVLVFGSVSMEKERDNEKCDYSNKKPQSIRLNQSSGVEGDKDVVVSESVFLLS